MGRKKKEKVETPNVPSGPVHFIAGGNKKKSDGSTPDFQELAETTIARNREGISYRPHVLSGPHIGNRGRARKVGSKNGNGHV